MPWKCPDCGLEDNDSSLTNCRSCGYINFPKFLILTSESSGQRLTISIDSIIGKHLVRMILPDDYLFFSEEQFKLFKNVRSGHWAIQPCPDAVNPTFLNRLPLAFESKDLTDGSLISIGLEKGRMKVSFSP